MTTPATKQTANNNAALAWLKIHADEFTFRWISKAINAGNRTEAIRLIAEGFNRPSYGGFNKVAQLVGMMARTPAEQRAADAERMRSWDAR